jgi:hypothetical protein
MKSKREIIKLYNQKCYKKIEEALEIKIRNGQTIEGVRKALKWVLNGD